MAKKILVTHPPLRKNLRASIAVGNTTTSVMLWNSDGSVEKCFPAFFHIDVPLERGDAIIMSTVVPATSASYVRALRQQGANVFIFRRDIHPKIEIIPEPAENVGHDRIAVAMGALALDATVPWVVADLGTAMTCNAVSPARGQKLPRFEGGLIAPGTALSLAILREGTAQLPLLDQTDSDDLVTELIGTNTESAIRNGIAIQQVAGLLAMIEGQRTLLGSDTKVVLAGGGAPSMMHALDASPHLRLARHFEILHQPHLLHMGLKSAWDSWISEQSC